MHSTDGIHLAWHPQGFTRLGTDFVTYLQPTPLPAPQWVARTPELLQDMGWPADFLDSELALQALTGNALLPGSAPYASVYSGHQFGVWAGQLGDGRAIGLGETSAGWELQLKGAGRTPYSRGADGRAVLRSSIREFLCSEAMHALGIPTTRALSLTASPASVVRETIETAAVVARAAPSFVRFGHFEHFAARDMLPQLRALANYVIERYYPECQSGWQHQTPDGTAVQGNAYAALLHAVGQRTAQMVAQWQTVGFCHGVMNTDNMSILGLTLDYGPFQFLDTFDPAHICNHSDQQGRYAFNKQPQVAYWNLFCLGQALLPLIEDQDVTIAALEAYRPAFSQAFAVQMAKKMGWSQWDAQHSEAMQAAIGQLLQLLADNRIDHTIFWRRFALSVQAHDVQSTRELFLDTEGFDRWYCSYEALGLAIDQAPDAAVMLRHNPQFVLRNHMAEEAIQAAQQGDFSIVQNLAHVLKTPYADHPQHHAWADFPPDWAASIAISCSS